MAKLKSLCVYCGSQAGNGSAHLDAARNLGKMLADNHVSLVYGGGTNGIMGAVAQSTHENGGHVTGIIPEFLLEREANSQPELYCNKTIVTQDMHERKHIMFENSDGFLALPGGIGTLEELVEMMTWAQLGRHTKPIGIYNQDGFWSPFIELLSHMEENGFLHSIQQAMPQILENSSDLSGFLGVTA